MLIDFPALPAAGAKKSADSAAFLFDVFRKSAQKHGVACETFSECFTAEVPARLTEYARLRDLTILPVHAGDNFDQWYAESIIFGSGRPTLVIPPEWKKRIPFGLETAVVAWDFSGTAVRAVADALPLLEKTKKVYILIVKNEKELDQAIRC